tara:strand:- start:146 stop:460 length:315 start_codon:yes stop_codon:yes gene_type:complete
MVRKPKKWKNLEPHEKWHRVGTIADAGQQLADLGKQAFGTSEEERQGYRDAPVPEITPSKSAEPGMTTRVKWQDESAIVSPENAEYEQLKADMFGKKKKNGKKT